MLMCTCNNEITLSFYLWLQQASFEYAFKPHESFGGRPFGLTINLAYKDSVRYLWWKSQSIKQGREKPRSDCPGQVNFALGQVTTEVQWPQGASEISLSSLVSLNKNINLINENFQSEAISKLKTTRLVNH